LRVRLSGESRPQSDVRLAGEILFAVQWMSFTRRATP
jgi:hypothetical protein